MNYCKLKIKSENEEINLDSNKINDLFQNKKTRCNTGN